MGLEGWGAFSSSNLSRKTLQDPTSDHLSPLLGNHPCLAPHDLQVDGKCLSIACQSLQKRPLLPFWNDLSPSPSYLVCPPGGLTVCFLNIVSSFVSSS